MAWGKLGEILFCGRDCLYCIVLAFPGEKCSGLGRAGIEGT